MQLVPYGHMRHRPLCCSSVQVSGFSSTKQKQAQRTNNKFVFCMAPDFVKLPQRSSKQILWHLNSRMLGT